MNKEKYLNFSSRALLYIFVLYLLFLLGKSLWTNYHLRVSIRTLNLQIATLEQQKIDLANLNVYYRSDSFKELEARRKLGLKRPDEKIFLVSGATTTTTNFEEELEQEQEGVTSKEENLNQTKWQLWWEYFME